MNVLAHETHAKDGRLVVIRSARPDDAPAVLAFARALTREAFRNLDDTHERFDALTEDDEAAFLGEMLRHPRNFFLCAFHAGHVLGSANVRVDPGALKLHVGEIGMGVLEIARGQGLGRALMERLIFAADANGVTNLHLRVRTFNEPAIRLYESVGFRRVGTLEGVAKLPEGLADEHIYQRVSHL